MMNCPKCGKTISDESKFCSSCGTAIVRGKTHGRMQLVCNSCGNIMTPDKDNQILFCPACGSKELILEDPDVTIQRIKSKTEKEIELERLKHEEKRQLREIEKEEKEEENLKSTKYKKSKLAIFSMFFFFICLIITIMEFRNGFSLRGVIALVQTILFALSWLMGSRILKVKSNSLHTLTAILGFVLIVPFFMVSGAPSAPQTFEWQTTGLYTMIPEPKTNEGSITEHIWGELNVYVHNTTKEDYDEYKQACIDKGFTHEVSDYFADYKAYTDEGYALSLSYRKSNQIMEITVETPKAIGEYKWPKSEIANLIPQYESKIGKILVDSVSKYEIYIGDVDLPDFNSYVDKCAERGFVVDYNRKETSYEAQNKNGYNLYIAYEDYRTMHVRVSEPEKEESTDQPTTEPTEKSKEEKLPSTSAPENGSARTSEANDATASTGVRKEVKEAIDGYEAFFKKYADFMKKYAKSSNPLSMMTDYTSMMMQYTENMEKWEKLDEDYTFNDAELKYYTDATLRINKLLMEAAQE